MAGRRVRVRLGDVARLLAGWLASALALVVADRLLPGLSAVSGWAYVAVAAVAGIIGLVARPVLVEVSARIGWLAVIAMAIVGQALIMYVAIRLVPGITVTFGSAVAAAWITAAVSTGLAYVTTAGTDDGLLTSLTRRRTTVTVPDPDVDGVIFVQLDGVAFPVLRWAIQAGGVPTIRRWLASGDYVLREWRAQLPCTTPASQLGLLHGTVEGVPAFRWYDRELGRAGGESAGRRPRDRGARQHRPWSAGRRWRVDLESVQR